MYVLRKPSKRQKIIESSQAVSEGAAVSINDPKVPFLRLLYGEEPIENVKLRYHLYQNSIQAQDTIAKKILDETSDQILTNISNIINLPINNEQLDSVLLLSSSSFTSSSSFISQLTSHLLNGDHNNHRVVRLSSKECNTIKVTLKKIVSSILYDTLADGDNFIDNDSDEEENNVSDESEEEEDDDDDILLQHKRLPFDLDSIVEWCQQIYSKKNESIDTTSTRIVLLFEDTDSFNIGLLNHLIKLIHRFTNRIPFRLIFNIGTNVENFSKKLDNELHFLLKFHQFKIEQTGLILNKIVSDIILQGDFLIGNESIYFLLNRFQNSTRDVNEFLKCLKFLKMSFFFNQPFAIIGEILQRQNGEILLNDSYYAAIKNTESFRDYINQSINSDQYDPDEILALINQDNKDNDLISKLVINATNDYIKNLSNFKTVFKIITNVLLKHVSISKQTYLEILAKLTNKDELVRNQLLNEILTSLKKLEIDALEDLLHNINEEAANNDLLQSLNSKVKAVSIDLTALKETLNDPESSKIQFKIDYRKLLESLISTIDFFLKKSFKNPFELLFNEVFQLNDLDILKSTIIPQTRTIIEDSLTDPELYINMNNKSQTQDPLERLNIILNPIICELFQIYRETSLNLNIYDFYQVFKNSLRSEEIMKLFMEILDNTDLLEKYLNDADRFKFIYIFFNDADISNEMKFDKLMLVFFLQKCGELIDCGFLKQIKRKGDSLEKCIWRGL